MSIIQTKKLKKSYGSKNSVYDINLSANEGEIYGFLGLNGAGKTTTMRMLLKMINPILLFYLLVFMVLYYGGIM